MIFRSIGIPKNKFEHFVQLPVATVDAVCRCGCLCIETNAHKSALIHYKCIICDGKIFHFFGQPNKRRRSVTSKNVENENQRTSMERR